MDATVELAQLRIRVIALENLVITLLAELSEQQLDLAREMAAYISPRPGFTHHRPTLHAAAQMVHLAERADHFRRTASQHVRLGAPLPAAVQTDRPTDKCAPSDRRGVPRCLP